MNLTRKNIRTNGVATQREGSQYSRITKIMERRRVRLIILNFVLTRFTR